MSILKRVWDFFGSGEVDQKGSRSRIGVAFGTQTWFVQRTCLSFCTQAPLRKAQIGSPGFDLHEKNGGPKLADDNPGINNGCCMNPHCFSGGFNPRGHFPFQFGLMKPNENWLIPRIPIGVWSDSIENKLFCIRAPFKMAHVPTLQSWSHLGYCEMGLSHTPTIALVSFWIFFKFIP